MRGNLEEAEAEARRAEGASSGAPGLRAHALAMRASALLAAGRAEEALALAEEAARILEAQGGVEEGEALIRLTHIRALSATGRAGDARARAAEAQARLRVTAARIGDPRYRKSFLQNVPENAAIMALAADEAARAGDSAQRAVAGFGVSSIVSPWAKRRKATPTIVPSPRSTSPPKRHFSMSIPSLGMPSCWK